MKTIDRYVLSEFFRIFFLGLVTLMAFYEMVVFLDMSGYFFKFGATVDEIARFMTFKIPMALFHVTPICVLLASLLAVGSLSRYSELVAMKASGMSLIRVSASILVASAAISALSFADSEYLFHLAAKETNRIYYEEIKEQPRKGLFSEDKFWYTANDGSIWNIGHIDMDKKELRDLSIFNFDESGQRLESRISASSGVFKNGKWTLYGYTQRKFFENGKFEERWWRFRTLPEEMIAIDDLDMVELDPEEMNLAQIREYINDIRSKGYDSTRYTVDMHAKVAFPLISLVMPLIAVPMGVRSSRAGGALVGIAIAVVIGALFWFSFSMGLAFGHAGRLPPLLAVYGAHVVFAALGVILILSDN